MTEARMKTLHQVSPVNLQWGREVSTALAVCKGSRVLKA
jgi:hypothetical protein